MILCLERVAVGNVGVVYSANGVEDQTLSQGWHFMSPFKSVKQFPISQQQLVLSNNPGDYNEKEHADWSIDAPANGGMVKINMTVNYNFLPDRVVDVYKQFNEAITTYLNERLTEEYGINVSSALVIDVQLDETLQQKVQAKEQAKQDAEIAELEKQTAKAQAETDKVVAESEAQVKVIEAQAEADANRIIAQSITPELIQMKEAEARLKHGWVEVQGADTVVTNQS